MDEAILDAQLAMRLRSLRRHRAFVPSGRAEARVRDHLRRVHADGTVRVHEAGGRVAGVLAWRLDLESWYGTAVSAVALDDDPAAPGVVRWLADTLDRELPRMEADLDLLLDPSYVEAYDALRARGVGVDSVQLLGDPAVARARLRAEPWERVAGAHGLTLVPLADEHVDAVVEGERATFARHPEFCWFGALDGWVERQRRQLRERAAQKSALDRVLLSDGEVVGHVLAVVEPDNAFWGPTAGMGLWLAPRLRGRGLLRPLYRVLLDGMIEQGARTFKGGTSQRPVLRLGHEMGRPLHGLLMRRRTFFDEAHFAPYLPLRQGYPWLRSRGGPGTIVTRWTART